MRKIDDAERFSAFIVAFQRIVADATLYKLVWTSGREMDRDLDSMIDCFVNVAKAHALNEMFELLEVGSKYTHQEINIIQEPKQ